MQIKMKTDNTEDLCRCCHSKGSFKSLNSCLRANEETFAALLIGTFNIIISSSINTSWFCICEDCIHKLNGAATFKQSVLECEENFYKIWNSTDDKFCIDEDIKTEKIDGDDVENDINNDEKPTDNEESVPTELEPEDEFEETIEEHVTDIESGEDSDMECVPEPCENTIEDHIIDNADSGESDDEYIPDFSEKTTKKDLQKTDSEESVPDNNPKNRKGKEKRKKVSSLKKKQEVPCSYCKMTFVHHTAYKKHLKKNHFENYKRVCDVCGKKFLTISNLANHKKHVHFKPFGCTKCSKTFNVEKYLKRHDYKVHGGDNPYTCIVCDKQFETESQFIVHRRIHTGETPYSCNKCDREFMSESSLHNHVKYTHKQKQRVKKECEICNKQFSHLTKHMLTAHSDEKPFGCSVCDKRFTLKEYLRLHMRSHTGERPYSCEICDKKFTQPNVLKTHVANGVCSKNNKKSRKSET